MPSMKCICTIQQNFPQGNIVEHRGTVDRCGHHLLTGCSTTNSRIEIHNTIVRELNSILRYCGLRTKEEEINAFKHPVTGESISAHRPDISVLNPSFYTTKKKLVLDIAITTPLVGVQGGTTVSALGNSVKVMKEPFKNGKNKYNQKIAKYENEILQHILPIDPNAIHVLPIVMETTGAIHPEFDKFLKKIAAEASNFRKIPDSILYNFFRKRISTAFHGVIGKTISNRMFLLRSNLGTAVPSHGFENEHIMNQ